MTVVVELRQSQGVLAVQLPMLAFYRKKRFLSQSELAEASGVHVTTIKRLEAGYPAHGRTIRKLATALNVDPEALVEPLPEQGQMQLGKA